MQVTETDQEVEKLVISELHRTFPNHKSVAVFELLVCHTNAEHAAASSEKSLSPRERSQS